MERILDALAPNKVFYYFEEISRIPRGSGNEKQISDYLYDLAIEKGLEVIQDEALNIIIKKPGTAGYEKAPTVILQGHMDMVCEKNSNSSHDFEKDPIELRIVDDYIYGTDTTLGADNGIAVAMCLAILDSDNIPHPPLEVLVTTDEESGMTGANSLDATIFEGKILINLDSEGEGIFTVGCAGGGNIRLMIPVKKVESSYSNYLKISVKGLNGGHSGVDIDTERGNANKVLGRVLYEMKKKCNFDLTSIKGGLMANAIPREAEAIIITDDAEAIKNLVSHWQDVLGKEYIFSDPDILLSAESITSKEKAFTEETSTKLLTAINLTPNGPITRSTEIDLVVQSNNLGAIITEADDVVLSNVPRSSVESLLYSFCSTMEQLAKTLDAKIEVSPFIPGWEYARESFIRDTCVSVYEEMTEKKAQIEAVHAGLECGFLIDKIGHLDAISFGPDMYDVHTPDERLSIPSVGRTYDFLCEVLGRIK